MQSNYKRVHQIIASIVLFSLFLQSCGGGSNQLVPLAHKAKLEVRDSIKRKDIASVVGQEFIAEKGYLVTFHERNGNLQAHVKTDASQEEFNYINVPVFLGEGACLTDLSYLDTSIQQRRIQVERSSTGRPSRIVILQEGLRGGMMEGEQSAAIQMKMDEEDSRIQIFPVPAINVDKSLYLQQFLPIIPKDEIEINYVDSLGSGGFGTVYKAIYKQNIVAIKKLHLSSLNNVSNFQKEAIIMANHRHKNIVAFLGFCLAENALVMEYMPGGSLEELLIPAENNIPWEDRYEIALDIAEGIEYLHDCGIVHSDIKSGNVLLDSKRKRAKLTDFGISGLRKGYDSSGISDYGERSSLSLPWAAPEIFETVPYKHTKPGDVYSFGMILWQLGARKNPTPTMIGLISKGDHSMIDENNTPLELRKIIELCWLPEPPLKKATDKQSRPNIREVRQLLEKAMQGEEKEKELLRSELEKLKKEKEELIKRLEQVASTSEKANGAKPDEKEKEKEREKEFLQHGLDQPSRGNQEEDEMNVTELENTISKLSQGNEFLDQLKGVKEGEKLDITDNYRLLRTDQCCILFQHPRFKQITLKLSGIGNSEVRKLSIALSISQSQIYTLDLGSNDIGVSGAQRLAKALLQSQIHTLDLGSNDIGGSGAQELAKALPQSRIHTLNLRHNNIGNLGAQELANALIYSPIHTLDLGYNKIGVTGAQELAKALLQSRIHTLDLSYNEIGDSGAQELAKVLPQSKIHMLNLSHNNIGLSALLCSSGVAAAVGAVPGVGIGVGAAAVAAGAGAAGAGAVPAVVIGVGAAVPAVVMAGVSLLYSGLFGGRVTQDVEDSPRSHHSEMQTLDLIFAQTLSKALPDSQIHTLNLSDNNIEDAVASELAKDLPHSQIHTLDLSRNNIGEETQSLLKKMFPDIKFGF